MKANSRPVASNQTGIHKNLDTIVIKQQNCNNLKPIASHNRLAFDKLLEHCKKQKIILDSGCGNARSSVSIARAHADCTVIAIDKSRARLDKLEHQHIPDNLFYARADLNDIFRLLAESGIQLYKHFILYPNPWPKGAHLQRRWHGSTALKYIVALGGELELRSNWRLYLDEFAYALSHYNRRATVEQFDPTADEVDSIDSSHPLPPGFLTNFEEKYHRSGQVLWRLRSNLDQTSI